LPFDLQQVVRKYPVTLYTGTKCGPCGSGRALLTSRGVPFAERTITTAQDADALQHLSGDNSLPVLTIGTQQLKGFSETEWTEYLNAAGYPKTSELPSGYRNPAPQPLVAEHKPAAPAASPPAQQTATTPEPGAAPARNTQDNPAGIRF
jgi:glutaredoxin